MAGKKGAENSKKAAGNARKADAAAQKSAAADARKEVEEAAQWDKGSKNNNKKEAEAAKKAEQARKKAEKDALAAEEDRNLPSKAKTSKSAPKKTRGLDLGQLDEPAPGGKATALNASGIDNALDALSLGAGGSGADKVDRHPERRFRAAYAAYEERRLAEMDADGSGAGLRLNQRKDRLRKEFERSPENPFNQVNARFDSTREEIADIKKQEKDKIEARLTR